MQSMCEREIQPREDQVYEVAPGSSSFYKCLCAVMALNESAHSFNNLLVCGISSGAEKNGSTRSPRRSDMIGARRTLRFIRSANE
jgi:hypothetical protein